MFELFVASEAVRRKIGQGLEPETPKRRKAVRARRGVAVRSTSAAALRRVADRLEPSAS